MKTLAQVLQKTNDFWQCLRKYFFLAVYEFPLSGQASTRPQAFCSITRIYKISFLQWKQGSTWKICFLKNLAKLLLLRTLHDYSFEFWWDSITKKNKLYFISLISLALCITFKSVNYLFYSKFSNTGESYKILRLSDNYILIL